MMRMQAEELTGQARSSRAVLLLATLGFLCGSVCAQLNQGSIAGNVLDPSGATVASAKITAVGVATGTRYETVSGDTGHYRVPNMTIGAYDVTVVAPGFKSTTSKGVVVEVGTTAALDVKLQPGAVTEVVSVEGDVPTVQTESSEIGTVVSTKQIDDLPLPLGSVVQAMRSPESFVFLTPGATGPGTANGNGGTFESKISGGQNYATEVLLDGVSTFRSENGSSFDETAPSVDALSEFKVTTSTMPPEMGRTTGGVESFNTASGSNTFHGKVYEIFRNEDMNANSFFNNHEGLPRNLDRRNDYGLTFGGPVWIPKVYNGKDRTFFFFSWEQFRQNQGGVSNITVPTAKELAGDFSETLGAPLTWQDQLGNDHPVINPCDNTQILAGQIFDPTTTKTVTTPSGSVECRLPFAGNMIPQSSWSTAGVNILSHYPTPQNSNLINNFVYPWSYPILDTTMTMRFDQNIGTAQKVYFTYSSRDNRRTSTQPNWNDVAGQGRQQDFSTHFIRIGWDYSITATMLSHLSLGYNRTNSKNVGAGVAYGKDWAQTLGITGLPNRNGPYPVIGVIGEHSVIGQGDDVYGDTIDNGYRFNYDLSWVKGKHNFKAGFDWRYQVYDPIDYGRTSGAYYFWRQQTSAATQDFDGKVTNLPDLTGNSVASLLLGEVHDANAIIQVGQPKWLSPYYGMFFQDSYKVTKNLVLSYGVRYDIDMPRREKVGDTSNISLTAPNPGADGFPGALVFAGKGAGRNGNVNETWADPWYKDVGPRVGFAWSPDALNGKTVIRGGFGIIYGPLLYADFGAFTRTGFKATPNFNSFYTAAFNLDSGFPAFAAPPSLDPAQLNYQGGVQYIDPSFGRPGMINNWSMEIQHELATDLIFNIAYVGQHSTHLRTNFNYTNSLHPEFLHLGTLLNTPFTSQSTIPAPYPSFTAAAAPTAHNLLTAQALVPMPQYFGFNTDGALENNGQSSYNALEATFKRRFHKGLNLLASYTWSKTLTDADAALPFFATLHGGGSAQNPFNKRGEKAVSNQDIPQTLVLSYVYELPLGKNKKFLAHGGVVDKVVGGWQVAGIHRYQSGQPLSFCCAAGIPAFAGAIRPNRVQGQSILTQQFTNGPWDPFTDKVFNAAAFGDPNAVVGPNGYQFGNMPRTTAEVRSFKYYSEDFNLIKRTSVTERAAVVFEASFIDAFNRHIFNRPDTGWSTQAVIDPTSSHFGLVDPASTLVGPRNLQLKLKVEF